MLTHLAMKDKRIVERELNKLIRWIYELNFDAAIVPEINLYQAEDVDKVLAERDKMLKEIGVKFSKEYFVKNYNLAEGEFGV